MMVYFLYFLHRVTTRYFTLAYALQYMLPYCFGNFAAFSTFITLNILRAVLLNVVIYIYSQMSTVQSNFRSVNMIYFIKNDLYLFLKNLTITHYNSAFDNNIIIAVH